MCEGKGTSPLHCTPPIPALLLPPHLLVLLCHIQRCLLLVVLRVQARPRRNQDLGNLLPPVPGCIVQHSVLLPVNQHHVRALLNQKLDHLLLVEAHGNAQRSHILVVLREV